MVPHWYCPGLLEPWRAPSFALGFSQCNVFILDSVLCLSLCQWWLQSAGEVSYKQDFIWALTEFKGDKFSVLFCWSGTETKLLALGLGKGEKKNHFSYCATNPKSGQSLLHCWLISKARGKLMFLFRTDFCSVYKTSLLEIFIRRIIQFTSCPALNPCCWNSWVILRILPCLIDW